MAVTTAQDLLNADPRLRVETLSCVPNPQTSVWLAMHQDYAKGCVGDLSPEKWPTEGECGRRCVKYLCRGRNFHGGPYEHPQIVLSTGGFPHSVMQQARTHRSGYSFDVQSLRYTSEQFFDVRESSRAAIWHTTALKRVEDVFYLRPVGFYTDRQGGAYKYTDGSRYEDMTLLRDMLEQYCYRVESGMPEEQARGLLPFDFRQHFVVSMNMRALMHFLDMRAKKDAQLEIQALCILLMREFQKWAPEVAEWYSSVRLGKGLLAP